MLCFHKNYVLRMISCFNILCQEKLKQGDFLIMESCFKFHEAQKHHCREVYCSSLEFQIFQELISSSVNQLGSTVLRPPVEKLTSCCLKCKKWSNQGFMFIVPPRYKAPWRAKNYITTGAKNEEGSQFSPKYDFFFFLHTSLAIPDESTKGIANLVAKQKSNHKVRNSVQKGRASVCSGPSSRRRVPYRGRVPPILPAVVKSELKDLLALSPVLLSDFENAFANRFGRSFQYVQYGFLSMFEVLNAASDVISVEQTRAGSLLTLKKSVSEEKQRGWPAGKHISTSNHTADQQILELLYICVYMYTCNG